MPGLIENYALTGNCESAALVGHDGSIDWPALPRFDSAACFAALSGDPETGRWQIAPREDSQITRRYREGTLILETRFETPDGAVTLVDCMGRRDGLHGSRPFGQGRARPNQVENGAGDPV
jgi:GH15 family glucan-1,4-alpha-glucosidase